MATRPRLDRVALGLDLGLSGTRAVVVAEDGAVLSSGVAARDARTATGGFGQPRPVPWRQEAIAATRQALSGLGGIEVSVIGVGGLGPNTVLVDAKLEILAGPLSFNERQGAWADPESAPVATSTDNVVPKLGRLKQQRPELFESAAWALDTTGCLVAWLTGVPVMDVLTAADYRLADMELPVPVPTASAPDAVAGTLRPAVSEELGVASGTPVTVGTYDSYVDMLAMGLASTHDGALLLGSTMVAAALVDEASGHRELGLCTLEWPFTKGLLVGGWTSAAGAAIDWLARTVRPEVEQAAAELPPGAGGLLFLPYLAGERTPAWDPAASGAIAGLTLETTPAELRRAVLDGVALSTRDTVARIEAVGGVASRWRVGGGGTRHRAWLQATADATGKTLEVLDTSGGIGAAVLAFRSIGIDVALEPTSRVGPDPGAAERFNRLFPVYETLYPALAQVMHSLQAFRSEHP